MVSVSRMMSVVAGLLVLAGPVSAASLQPDLRMAGEAPDNSLRDGDFDGDGRRDSLLLVAEDSGRVAVHVRLDTASGPRDIRVTSLTAEANRPLDIDVVAAGTFAGDCGDYADACQARIIATHDSLVVGLGGDTRVLIHWQDGQFEQDFVRTGDSLSTLAGLLARNP